MDWERTVKAAKGEPSTPEPAADTSEQDGLRGFIRIFWAQRRGFWAPAIATTIRSRLRWAISSLRDLRKGKDK